MECVYFADVVTEKKVLIFTRMGELLRATPLNEAVDSLGQIDGIAVPHPDTIILCGAYNNKVAMFDGHGHCTAIADLTKLLHRPNGLSYELWPSFFSSFLINGRVCLGVSLVANSIDGYHELDAPHGNELYTYEWLSRQGPHFVSFDLKPLTDSLQLNWGPETNQRDTMNPIAHMDRFGTYSCVNGHWFDISINSSIIQVLDPVSMYPERNFTVRSALGSVHREPIMIPRSGLESFQDSSDERYNNGGFIETIQFDVPAQRYLVILRQRSVKKPDGKRAFGGYTLQEYDVSFNFLRETVIKESRHEMPYMLCLSNGTFVMRAEPRQGPRNGIHTFDRLIMDGE